MNSETQLAILVDKLRLPNGAELEPWLKKLVDHPDSIIIVAIEKPLRTEGPLVATAWLSAKERLKVRKALTAINASRAQRNEQLTSEMPCH